ncbi:hypothetical protein ACRRTK_019789 [Alexandromys fortis]
MVDRGPLLTSAIIFYLAIGAAIFEVLEEPHWKEAKKNYYTQKLHLLKEFPCLSQEGLDKILQGRCRARSTFLKKPPEPSLAKTSTRRSLLSRVGQGALTCPECPGGRSVAGTLRTLPVFREVLSS